MFAGPLRLPDSNCQAAVFNTKELPLLAANTEKVAYKAMDMRGVHWRFTERASPIQACFSLCISSE